MKNAAIAVDYGPQGYKQIEVRIEVLGQIVSTLPFSSGDATEDFQSALIFCILGGYPEVDFDRSLDAFLEFNDTYQWRDHPDWGGIIGRRT